jgi:hypothetical protein
MKDLCLFTQFPIDLEQFDRREQLKKSGLGKVDSVSEIAILEGCLQIIY